MIRFVYDVIHLTGEEWSCGVDAGRVGMEQRGSARRHNIDYSESQNQQTVFYSECLVSSRPARALFSITVPQLRV